MRRKSFLSAEKRTRPTGLDLPEPDEGQGAGQGAGRFEDKYRDIFKANPVVKTCKVSKARQRRSVDPGGRDPDHQDAP